MESDLSAARRIQDTLHPHGPVAVTGYHVESELHAIPCRRRRLLRRRGARERPDTLRHGGRRPQGHACGAPRRECSGARSQHRDGLTPSPLTLATRINEHLSRYTPDDRFVTAVFAVLAHASGNVAYVNAGHNAPILARPTSRRPSLEATGVPLGLFAAAPYEIRDRGDSARRQIFPPLFYRWVARLDS